MKIIRWLLSHFFLILLVVVVIYGYMFWGNLAGEDTPAGKVIAYLSSEFEDVREFVDAVKAKNTVASADVQPEQGAEVLADISASEPVMAESTEAVPADASVDTVLSDEVQAQTAAAGSEIDVPPASVSYQYKDVQVMQDSGGRVEMQETEVASAAPATEAAPADETDNEVKGSFVPPETVEQLNNVDNSGQIIDPSKQADQLRQTWIAARKSFYLRDYKKSEESYRKIIDSSADNFDAYGELGNVYFNQGKRTEAAAAYYEAAAILVRKGQVQRARSLIGLLRHLDREKAVELQKLIESAAS